MKELFRTAYSTRIKALTELLQKYADCAEVDARGNVRAAPMALQPSPEEVRSTGVQLMQDIHDFCVFSRAQKKDVSTLRPGWDEQYVSLLEKISAELHSTAPEMYDVPFSIDVQSWLQRNTADINTDVNLSHLQAAHIFGIEKDPKNNNTYLYNSFLADSTRQQQQREAQQHHYPNQMTGSYTTRSILYSAAAHMPHAPRRRLAVPIDFTLHRETVRAFAKDHLEADENKELNDMLDQMEQRVKDDAAGCPLCKDLMLQLSAVGVISRKPDATEEEKKINSEKTRIKEKIRRELKMLPTSASRALSAFIFSSLPESSAVSHCAPALNSSDSALRRVEYADANRRFIAASVGTAAMRSATDHTLTAAAHSTVSESGGPPHSGSATSP